MTRDAVVEREAALQVNRQEYLDHLSEADQNNLGVLMDAFKSVFRKDGRKAVLIAAGGQLNKPQQPRKDIDILLGFEPKGPDPVLGNNDLNFHEWSLAHFAILKKLVEEMISQMTDFKIKSVVEPNIDLDFKIPGTLRSVGSITIKPEKGTEIEVIRIPDMSDPVKEEPYAILAAV
ncbi:MAG: hypothetical protein ACD_57C00343G0002 [uncultured bacterium]|uniref:Polymerase nucleotidyl transferase domain-containing protein n=1 Tax=Candidatus Curtissbacteria bacterium RIFOXYA1_FULL_41_14 TaxID=1797737 RepID=A0A1F5HFG6_9BACT|nr:MAG: hypothetical protein ACD_57C00343G0002 [uncultured bacterium]KKR56719.1 MAG: hypothetical protein UT95_C0036G0002 [Candidatus Curtissbacteria bacterium GW2011_GWB1_40_28]KKR60117.1 MAG: hypothetical protein UT99_C0018G0002 [Candidatus Curtissbacteria bacterium GW2011_GWA2_40_31]KKR60867.1 MAG: hypothetical protein UU00_C0025G0002 [Microgenomates group bacterium GW2011_GWC1_40_35]KKR65285.1 MAG: hypothetical protein UU05_C0023G0006 [Candidatus Curtissbacteria bacterium GW2011_GWA1_40_47]